MIEALLVFWGLTVVAAVVLYRAVPRKWLILGLVIFSVVVGGMASEMLGRGKPLSLQLVTREMNLLSYFFEPEEAIHIWVKTKKELRYFILPWSMKLAGQMQRAMGDRRSGRVGKILMEGSGWNPGDFKLKPEALQPLPRKD
jgi:hypothetical protein